MWWRRRRTDEDFAEEIRAHLALEVDRLVEEGMTPGDARAAAHREFGNVPRACERFHEARRVVWLEQLVQDLRYAWRGLWQSRAFVATTVLTLAVGMGLVTVVFAVFNAYVLRPFAVRDPYSLYSIGWRSQEAGGSTFRWSDYEEFRTRQDLFDGVVAEAARTVFSDGRQLAVGFVSGDYFDVLGARVFHGRGLVRDDARTPGGEPVAVLTYQSWTRLFDRDPAAVGRELDVNGRKLVIVGVMAAGFVGLDDVPRDVWVPLTMYGAIVDEDLFGSKQPRQLRVTARVRRDVTPQQAQGSLALSPFETRVAGRVDAVRARLDLHATPTRMTREGFAILSPVFAAFVLVMVAACANASNVMLARANARHREIGVRLSIGASRGRVVRQLMTEGLLIAILAGLAALALAGVLLRIGTFLFVVLLPPTVASRVRFVPLDFDHRVFLFALVVAGAATILFALLPALQATRLTLTDALRGQPSGGVRSSTLRNVLVTSQVAVSLLLLVVAATLVRNGAAVRATDLGMDTDGVISVRQRRGDKNLVARAHTALAADPRLEQVIVTSRVPLFGEAPKIVLTQPAGFVLASYRFVSPEYFALLDMPIVRGRGFAPEEARQEAAVTIVSAAGASVLWPGEDPIGKTLRVNLAPPGQRIAADIVVHELRKPDDIAAGSTVVTVIGVTTDVVSGFVYEGRDPAHLYLPTSATGSRADALMVRLRPAAGERGASARQVRLRPGASAGQVEERFGGAPIDTLKTVLREAHPDPLAFDVLAVDEMVALQMFPLRAASWIGSLLSAVALALSISGLYGVLTYTFGQRTQEIGIRMALGASASAVVRLVAVQSARLAGLGAAVGVLLAFTVMKLLSAVIRLENVSVVDPGAFAVSVVLIAGAVALASYGPARRAARVDPSSMLRADA
jgi:predicted permease